MAIDAKELLKLHEPKRLKQSFECDKQQHTGARFSPCGKYLLAGSYTGAVLRWDATSDEYKTLPSLAGHHGYVVLAYAQQGGLVYSGDSWGRLRAWSYSDEQPKPKWDIEQAHDGWLRDLAVSPDGKQLATCGRDHMLRIWDTATGKKLHELQSPEDLFCVLWHKSGKSLVTGDHKGIGREWDLATLKSTREFNASVLFSQSRLQDIGGIRVLSFDRDAKTLAVGGVKPANGGNVQGAPTVLLFDWATGKLTKTIELSGDVFVEDIRFDPNGFLMLAVSGNPGSGKLVYVHLDDTKPFFEVKLSNCHALSVHPDGKRLAVSVTNANSSGNGRPKSKDGSKEYPGNWSQLVLFDLPQADAAKQT